MSLSMDEIVDSLSDGSGNYSSEAEEIQSHEPSESEREESPGVEIVPAKRQRKVPAKFKDLVCTPTASQAIEEFDTVMKASKLLLSVNFRTT